MKPGTREDRRTGQFIPTIDGKDTSPTSFDEASAMRTAETQCAVYPPLPHLRPIGLDDIAKLRADNARLREALQGCLKAIETLANKADPEVWSMGTSPRETYYSARKALSSTEGGAS